MQDILRFIHNTKFEDLPAHVVNQAELCVLDLIATGLGGSTLPASKIIRDHATHMMGGTLPLLFDDRTAGAMGVAVAGGMSIDALDFHDGYNMVKGHIGCGVFPALIAFCTDQGQLDGQEFLTSIAIGYELGARLGTCLHATASDYHTSGAWVAVACAAPGARILGLDDNQTRHAMGIAEYHGPRSQMMRTIDHPTMVKDGSGWGSMAGVSAAYLARDGFTGAPALTVESDSAAPYWADLGDRWYIMEQYFKPYPVCRWAQAPIEGVLDLRRKHNLSCFDVDRIEVASFHECIRLATANPGATDEAQYSTSYPCAAAMVRGSVGLKEVSPQSFQDTEIIRLSTGLRMSEDDHCNEAFPDQRYAKVTLHLRDGRVLVSDYKSPIWTAEAPPAETELRQKFHTLAAETISATRRDAIETSLAQLKTGGSLADLTNHLCKSVS